MRQDDIVENRKKLAWGARDRSFKSSHPDSFFSRAYEGLTAFLKSLFFFRWWMRSKICISIFRD
jgi:hypothetical protein